MRRAIALLLLFLGSAALSPAFAGKRDSEPLPPTLVDMAERGNLFLRGSFDVDPTPFLGRFVPDDDAAPDEARAMTTRCSPFITYDPEPVGAGGGQVDQYLVAGEGAAGRLGLPWLGAKGIESAFTVALVRYTETRKWRARVTDPAGLDDCCKRYPDQCTRRYIGEMVEGEAGEVFSAHGRARRGAARTGAAAARVKDGWSWMSSRTFPQPVYFAFRLTERAGGEVTHECRDKPWWNGMTPDGSAEGRHYFVGRSAAAQETLELAMEAARESALKQATQRLGGVVVTWTRDTARAGATSGGKTKSRGAEVQDTHLEAGGVVVGLTPSDECWSVAVDGQRWYEAGVLAWMPVTDTP